MFHWNRYLTLAQRLAASDDEAALRTAISRAYYAALHEGKEFCRSLRVRLPKGSADTEKSASLHVRVLKALQRHPDHRVRGASKRLASLRTWRNSADYDLPFGGSVNVVAHEAIISAERFIEELDRYRQAL